MSAIQAATALNTKTDKFFGLNKLNQESTVRPQKAGWLAKKPFSQRFGTIWRKRFFVVKDSFLFWYSEEMKPDEWGSKPKGCLPLGGCSIKIEPRDQTLLVISHPDFGGHVLTLRAADMFEAQEWVGILNVARRATWENAILGSALLEKMQAKGSEIEKEKDEIMQAAQQEALRLRAEQDEQDRLEEIKMDEAKRHASNLAAAQGKANFLKSAMSEHEMKLSAEQSSLEAEKLKRAELEKRLLKVQAALNELEQLLKAKDTDNQGNQYKDSATVLSSVQKLRNYFESKIKENQDAANRRKQSAFPASEKKSSIPAPSNIPNI